MSIFALVIWRGSTSVAFPCIWARAVAAQANRLVKLLLPKGRGRL